MHPSDQLAHSLLNLMGELVTESGSQEIPERVPALTTPFSNTSQADWAEAVRLWNAHGRSLIGGLPRRDCPAACANHEHRPLFESYDGYPYVECDDCGSWYVPLEVDAPLFERFFSDCPEAEEVSRRSFARRQSAENVTADLERINGYFDILLPLLQAGAGKAYLDVGCGLGYSLMAAKDRGMDGVGLESSRECISVGGRNGLDIRYASNGLPDDAPFDLITFWESLEHMADPAAVLSGCLPSLDEQGLLAFTIPNQNSPLVRAQRGDCSVVNGGCDTPGHINLFNPSSISRLLDRAGFSLLGLDGQYGMSLPELVSYMLGNNRGARDMLAGVPIDSGSSDAVTAITRAIGPAVTVLERVTFTAPILFGFACRKGVAERFSGAVRGFRTRRQADLLGQIAAMTPAPTGQVARFEWLLQQSAAKIAALERELEAARNPSKRSSAPA